MSDRKARHLRRAHKRQQQAERAEREILPERTNPEDRTVMVIPDAICRLADRQEGK